MVANCVNRKSRLIAIEAVIHDCIQILSRVGNARVTYIRRNHNYEAYELVQKAIVNGSFFRQGNAPQFYLDSCLCMNSTYCKFVTLSLSLNESSI